MQTDHPNTDTPREARLFRNNRSQAVRIPADFELPGDRVLIRRDGDRLILEPIRKAGILGLLSQWAPLDDGLPEIADRPEPAFDPFG